MGLPALARGLLAEAIGAGLALAADGKTIVDVTADFTWTGAHAFPTGADHPTIAGVNIATTNDVFTGFTPASAGVAASLDFAEDTDNGSSAVTLTAPASLSGDATVELPGTTGTLALVSDIPTFGDEAIAPADDSLLFYDATDGSLSRESVGDFLGAALGSGFAVAAGVASLDFNDLDDIGFNPGADSVAVLDADGNVSARELWSDFATAVAGAGLAATGGIFSVVGYLAADTGVPTSLDFSEDTDNGSNYIRLSAPAAITGDATLYLPDGGGVVAREQQLPQVYAAISGQTGGGSGSTTITLTIAITDANGAAVLTEPRVRVRTSTSQFNYVAGSNATIALTGGGDGIELEGSASNDLTLTADAANGHIDLTFTNSADETVYPIITAPEGVSVVVLQTTETALTWSA